jgi:antitoxin ParD1/3/4
MNVKTEITLTEDHLRYAERMVEEGAYPSISSVVEAGLAEMMLRGKTSDDPRAGMGDEIRRRMELPLDQWLPWDGDDMAERVKMKLRARYEK